MLSKCLQNWWLLRFVSALFFYASNSQGNSNISRVPLADSVISFVTGQHGFFWQVGSVCPWYYICNILDVTSLTFWHPLFELLFLGFAAMAWNRSLSRTCMKILRNLLWIRIVKATFMALRNTGTSLPDIYPLVLFFFFYCTWMEELCWLSGLVNSSVSCSVLDSNLIV